MRRKASITVFAALSLMLVAQLLFTLLEAARHYELQKVLYMNTDTVLESVFADYCSPLWETYKILGVRVDDISVLQYISPKLTTVSTNVEGVASTAVVELIQQIESEVYSPKSIYLNHKILDRDTL